MCVVSTCRLFLLEQNFLNIKTLHSGHTFVSIGWGWGKRLEDKDMHEKGIYNVLKVFKGR